MRMNEKHVWVDVTVQDLKRVKVDTMLGNVSTQT